MKNPSAKTRQYIYRVANVGLLVAVGYGAIEETKSALWLLLVNAVLGLADANVPKNAE